MFRNPALDFDQVLFVDMPFPQGSEWQHETRHRLGYMAVPGGAPAGAGRPVARRQAAPAHAPGPAARLVLAAGPLLRRPEGPVLLQAAQREIVPPLRDQRRRHRACAQTHRRPVRRPRPDLPARRRTSLFSTTRGHTYVRCMPPTNAFVLARCDRDGGNIYLISSNNEPDYLPSRDERRPHDLHALGIHRQAALARREALDRQPRRHARSACSGATRASGPTCIKDARAIPGSRRVMFTGSAHHDWFAGSVGIIDPDRGLQLPRRPDQGHRRRRPGPNAATARSIPSRSARYHRSGNYPAYYSPYPLGERDFLVSANRGGKFVLYLMDVDGNRELIYEGTHNIFHAMPLAPRAQAAGHRRPRRLARPARTRQHPERRRHLQRRRLPGRAAGAARQGRSSSACSASTTRPTPIGTSGPTSPPARWSRPCSRKGSSACWARCPSRPTARWPSTRPPACPCTSNCWTRTSRALQTMRSFASVMPGERRGCLGCHELHSRTPQPGAHGVWPSPRPPRDDHPAALARRHGELPALRAAGAGPVLQQVPHGRRRGPQDARPDCAPRLPGLRRDLLALHRPPELGRSPIKMPANPPPGFGIADTLMVEATAPPTRRPTSRRQPMTALSYSSRLIELVSSGKHHDVNVDPVSRLRLIAVGGHDVPLSRRRGDPAKSPTRCSKAWTGWPCAPSSRPPPW